VHGDVDAVQVVSIRRGAGHGVVGSRVGRLLLPAVAAATFFACRQLDLPIQKRSLPFQKVESYRIVSVNSSKPQRFLLQTSAGPVTVVSIGGIQRGSDLRLELITPVDLTLEPGTVTATVIAIGDSTARVRAVGANGLRAEGAQIEIAHNSVGGGAGCCPLPRGFKLGESGR
jgi:hypothetical protein